MTELRSIKGLIGGGNRDQLKALLKAARAAVVVVDEEGIAPHALLCELLVSILRDTCIELSERSFTGEVRAAALARASVESASPSKDEPPRYTRG